MLLVLSFFFVGMYVAFWLFIYINIYYPNINSNHLFLLFWILCLIFAVLVIVLAYKYVVFYKNKTKLKELQKYETIINKQKQNLNKLLLNNQNGFDNIYFDLLKIKTLLLTDGNEDAKKAFDQSYSNIKIEANKSVRYCSNTYVNAVLYNEWHLANEHNIEVRYQVLLPDKDCLDILDLPTILFNIIDNAINACKSQVSGKKYLDLKISYNGDYIIIYLINSLDKKDLGIDNGLDHGYGLTIVEDVVKKYDGHCIWQKGDNSFESKIILRYNLKG